MSTQEHLYYSTVTVVSENGLKGASTAKIAQRAEVANGTLFHHFKTKSELLRATYLFIQHDYMWHIMGLFDHNATAKDLAKRWKKTLRQSVDYWIRNPDYFEFVRQISHSSYYDEALKQEVDAIYSRFLDSLKDGADLDVLRGGNANVKMHLMLQSILMLVYLMLGEKDEKKQDSIRREGLTFIWRALKL